MALDSATASLIAQMRALGAPPLHELAPDAARAQLALSQSRYSAGPDVLSCSDEQVSSADGTEFTVRVLVPRGNIESVIVYLHGGGWVLGTLDMYEGAGRFLATQTNSVVVLVDYRLAPEHPFPAATEDSWAAVSWTDQNIERLAGRDVPLILAGDSAGGNLVAHVVRQSMDIGDLEIALQVLVYPVTDADFDRPSYRDPENQLSLNRSTMQWFWDSYAPDEDGRVRPELSPLRALDHSGQPAAIVLTAEHDVLRDEGEEYVGVLTAAGVDVVHRRFDGQMHGFLTMYGVLPGASVATEWVSEQIVRSRASVTSHL